MKSRLFSAVLLSAISASLLAATSFAQAVSDRGAFVMIQRGDTGAIERFTRTPDSINVDLTVKTQARFVYVAKTAKDFTIPQMTLQVYLLNAAADAPPAQTAVITMKGDSAIAEIRGGSGQSQTQRIKTTAGAVMLAPSSMTVFEQLTMKARSAPNTGVESSHPFTVPVFATAGGVTMNATVISVGTDSMVVTVAGQEYRLKVDPVGRILGGVAPAMAVSISRVDQATAASLTFGKPDYSAPAGAPYTAENVSIPNGPDVILGGTLTLPKNAKAPVPAVVTITGSGQQDRDEYLPIAGGYRPFRQIADTLGRRGIAVLRLDDRGVGSSTGNPSTSTSMDFAGDISAAVNYLRSRRDIDPARIALIGHSEGGLIAPLVAAKDPKVKAIVLMAGSAYNGRDIIRYQQRYAVEHDTTLTAAKRDSLLRLGAIQIDSLGARNPWMKFFLTYAPDTTAKRVKAPVLILQGATDRQVTAEQAEKLAAAFRAGGNRDVTVRVFPDHNHLFITDPTGNPRYYSNLTTNKVDPVVLGVIADWLTLKLQP
ncbi:MAG: alpha/beta hydrolase family protein [Gemmatimonadaceae bacterium]